ncbi:Dead-box atp-dependent rna helicase, partial [Thalictrum thalictroides]
GKKARGREKGGGNSGRGVRGVDFGLGIGFNPDSSGAPSLSVDSRSKAVNAVKSGMLTQFKSKFVAATSDSHKPGTNSNSSTSGIGRTVLSGFVSGGSIGGDINRAQKNTNTTITAAHSSVGTNASENLKGNAVQKSSQSSRERRRPSGWDR